MSETKSIVTGVASAPVSPAGEQKLESYLQKFEKMISSGKAKASHARRLLRLLDVAGDTASVKVSPALARSLLEQTAVWKLDAADSLAEQTCLAVSSIAYIALAQPEEALSSYLKIENTTLSKLMDRQIVRTLVENPAEAELISGIKNFLKKSSRKPVSNPLIRKLSAQITAAGGLCVLSKHPVLLSSLKDYSNTQKQKFSAVDPLAQQVSSMASTFLLLSKGQCLIGLAAYTSFKNPVLGKLLDLQIFPALAEDGKLGVDAARQALITSIKRFLVNNRKNKLREPALRRMVRLIAKAGGPCVLNEWPVLADLLLGHADLWYNNAGGRRERSTAAALKVLLCLGKSDPLSASRYLGDVKNLSLSRLVDRQFKYSIQEVKDWTLDKWVLRACHNTFHQRTVELGRLLYAAAEGDDVRKAKAIYLMRYGQKILDKNGFSKLANRGNPIPALPVKGGVNEIMDRPVVASKSVGLSSAFQKLTMSPAPLPLSAPVVQRRPLSVFFACISLGALRVRSFFGGIRSSMGALFSFKIDL